MQPGSGQIARFSVLFRKETSRWTIKFGPVEVKVGVGKLYVFYSCVVWILDVPHKTSHQPKNKET